MFIDVRIQTTLINYNQWSYTPVQLRVTQVDSTFNYLSWSVYCATGHTYHIHGFQIHSQKYRSNENRFARLFM